MHSDARTPLSAPQALGFQTLRLFAGVTAVVAVIAVTAMGLGQGVLDRLVERNPSSVRRPRQAALAIAAGADLRPGPPRSVSAVVEAGPRSGAALVLAVGAERMSRITAARLWLSLDALARRRMEDAAALQRSALGSGTHQPTFDELETVFAHYEDWRDWATERNPTPEQRARWIEILGGSDTSRDRPGP